MYRREFLSETIKAGGVALCASAFIKPASWAAPHDHTHSSTDSGCIQVKNKQELIDIIKNVTPGDEIVISAGTYQDIQVKIGVKATEKSPIIIRAAARHSAVFTGITQFYVTGHIL